MDIATVITPTGTEDLPTRVTSYEGEGVINIWQSDDPEVDAVPAISGSPVDLVMLTPAQAEALIPVLQKFVEDNKDG